MRMLKALRDKKGLSQARLAAKAEMNPVTIWRIETGQRSPTVKQLERIAAAMNMEVADFFPKVQVALRLEDRARTAGEVVAETIAVWGGEWLERVEKWDELEAHEKDLVIGRGLAAIEIRDALTNQMLDVTDTEEREELKEIVVLLNRVVVQVISRMKADNAQDDERIQEREKQKELETANE